MKRLGIILIVALFLFSNIFAQTGEGTVSGVEGIYFGKVIEPDKYVLGVGDIVRIYIILETGDPISFNVTVSPTGSINLPMVRAIKVSGLTLTEATREISKQLLKLYPRSNVIVDLVYPRNMKI
ncbi:MAG: polysaccharide biosynthesis/export family protein, partial [Dictyoglomus turgidum]|uniref:polysaccharide biosynthesis/export family protein n=1 Tax=Dictyoglomus turgidum TaxID=513050 RepID=UPI003C78C711